MAAEDMANMPPPSSQSHFENFGNFVPDNNASFDDEFSRLASSQDWVGGTKEYQRQRTIALRSELKLHYFSQSHELEEEHELTEEEMLQGYQALCQELGIAASDSIQECKRDLKGTLVNIVDLIDARRTGKQVKVWEDFEAFRNYTLMEGHTINGKEAAKEGGILQSLLQRLRFPRRDRQHGRRRSDSDFQFTTTTNLTRTWLKSSPSPSP